MRPQIRRIPSRRRLPLGPQLAIALAVLALSLVATGGCEKAAARPAAAPPKVSVRQPEAREVPDYDQYNGWMDAMESVEVRARVRGHIDKVNFTDGEIVKPGQVLFELDPRPFQADIGREQDQVKVYQAQKAAADKDYARLKDLLGKGGASQAQVDNAEAQAISLQAQVDATAQEVKRKELDLEYAKVTAPIGGRVSRAMMTQGNLVNAGGSDPVLTTIVSVNPIYVYFSVDERALQRYQKITRASSSSQPSRSPTTQPGMQPSTQAATVRNLKIPFKFGRESDSGFPYEGVLEYADNKVNKATGTIEVRGVVNNDEALFVPGSRVRARVAIGEVQKALVVPDTAVLSDQDKKYLLVVDDKQVVQRQDVVLGRLQDDGMRVVLAGGLKPSDWVITEGLQSARINYPVEPIRPGAAGAEAGGTTRPVK